jgi:hypothetical protein
VLRRLPDQVLEQLKQRMIQTLLEKKVLHKFRLFKRWFVVAIDGTGVMSFTHQHCVQCLYKRSKKGKMTYFHNLLEAKLTTASGFSISIATEWIENPEGEYDKQDCEVRFVDPKPGLNKDRGMGLSQRQEIVYDLRT